MVITSKAIEMDLTVKSLDVVFKGSRTYSYWGQFNVLEFKTVDGKYWGFADVNYQGNPGKREFRAYLHTQPFGSNVSGAQEFYLNFSAPVGFGIFTTRLTLKSGVAKWAVTDSAGAVTTAEIPLPVGFNLAKLVAAAASVYTTTDDAAWIDDLAFQCLQ